MNWWRIGCAVIGCHCCTLGTQKFVSLLYSNDRIVWCCFLGTQISDATRRNTDHDTFCTNLLEILICSLISICLLSSSVFSSFCDPSSYPNYQAIPPAEGCYSNNLNTISISFVFYCSFWIHSLSSFFSFFFFFFFFKKSNNGHTYNNTKTLW
eukprot:99565_1